MMFSCGCSAPPNGCSIRCDVARPLRSCAAAPAPTACWSYVTGTSAAVRSAALLRQALRPLVRVESAGFVRPNRAVPPEAIAAAGRRGVDLADHRSRLLTPDLARAADLIVVMDPVQQRHVRERFGRAVRDLIVLGDLDPAPPEGGRVRTIPDPIGQGSAVFETSYARIARCIAGLVSVFVGQAR